jgi:hypothetical protein
MWSGDALERLVGKGKAGKTSGEVRRRVAQVRGGRVDVMGRTVRVGAESTGAAGLLAPG